MSNDKINPDIQHDIDAVTQQLFHISEFFLRKHSDFLPHAAVLTESGKVKLVAASTEIVNYSTHVKDVLDTLHDLLNLQVKEQTIRAIGIAESVMVTPRGELPTKAIKVHFEHRRGVAIILYLPVYKKLFGGYDLGTPFSVPEDPQVFTWSENMPSIKTTPMSYAGI